MLTGIPAEIWQFGVAGLMFVVWWATHKQSNQSFVAITESSNDTTALLTEKMSSSYGMAIEDSREMNARLLDLMRTTAKEEQEHKAHMIRILSRMEEKLDQPLRCPMHVAANRQGGEA